MSPVAAKTYWITNLMQEFDLLVNAAFKLIGYQFWLEWHDTRKS